MKAIYMIIICLALFGCANKKQEATVAINPDFPHCQALKFLESKRYNYSFSKSAIPNYVRQGIGKIDGYTLALGDTGDVQVTNITDALNPGIDKYFTRLNYVLVNDAYCLICYTQGGIGETDVVDFVQYMGEFRLTRYRNIGNVRDTASLARCLGYDPLPEKL